jgi:hypothetical protein
MDCAKKKWLQLSSLPAEEFMSSQCDKCAAWSVSEFTYTELCAKWRELIGGRITDGYVKRFKKEGKQLNHPWQEVTLPFKFCAQGMLTRFYIVKNTKDTRATKVVEDCPGYTALGMKVIDFPVPSPLWTVCLKESHGYSRVKGQLFVPGLCENRVYFRIPAHGDVRPIIVDKGSCDVCGSDFNQGIMVKEVTYFCCNKHYLQWWRKEHPWEYQEFNKEK